MKKALRLFLTIVFTTIIGIAEASTAQWYGYALYSADGTDLQNHFISFDTESPNVAQAVSETLPAVWASTYVDGYVWFVTQTRSLCKAPFDEETQTIGDYETVVPTLEEYHLYIDMAYNPADGMMYYLCQNSQYYSYLKRSSLDNPSEIEEIGSFSVRMWTLAINAQGRAYGVAYEEGNLYEINLNDASTTLIGTTGKDVWYTQSMAFDLNTGELFWAQFANTENNGLYQVNTETAEVTSLGTIGSGAQLSGLFMVPNPQEPIIIDEIYVEGFVAPAWGEHPNYDMSEPEYSPYHITDVVWRYKDGSQDPVIAPEEFFDDEEKAYYLSVEFSYDPGYEISPDVQVYFNGEDSIFDTGTHYGDVYWAFTISYHVTDPTTDIDELSEENITVWPNPATNVLYLNVEDYTTISVFDITGRLVKQEPYNGKIDVSELTTGIYTIKADNFNVKFMKK